MVYAFSIGLMVLATVDIDRALLEFLVRLRLEPVMVLPSARAVLCSIRIVLMELTVCSSISRFLRMSTMLVNCALEGSRQCV